jgi:adenylate cyclase
MSWWARLRLRGKIFLPFSVLILAALMITLWLTQSAISGQVQATLKREMAVTGEVFRGRLQEQAQRLQTSTQLLAGDFALKRVVVTYDPETLASAALNYQRRIGVDLFWITDENGRLLADARASRPARTSVTSVAVLAEALALAGPVVGINEIEEGLFQLVAVPVLAPESIGFLVAGQEIDDRVAEQLREETGSHITFLSAAHVFASSWRPELRSQLVTFDHKVRGAGPFAADATFLLPLSGERWLSLPVPVEAHLPAPLFALVQRSYDEALAPLYALRRRLAGIGIAAIAGAMLVGAALAGGLAAPLQRLVEAMRQVLTGDFRQRLAVTRDDEIGFLARSFNEMVAGLEEREQIKDTFGRFVSRDIAEAVLNDRIPLAGERRVVTILFQDIRGFTSLTEQTDPDVLVGILNRFLTEMVGAIEAEGGVVRQFTGDGVMALFGAPVAHADDPQRAVRAALGMVERLAGLNAHLRAESMPPLRIGVGVHSGEVVAGTIGPDARIEYSVIGDAVNLASRIEGLTKEMAATLLVSAETAARLGPEFRFGRRAVLPVRGKEAPVEVVEVLGIDAGAVGCGRT